MSRRTSGTSAKSGFFCLSGVAIEWKELKDFIRAEIRTEPGWVEVIHTNAYFSVKTEEDANRAYNVLTKTALRGCRPYVHRFDDQVSPPQLVACNCSEINPIGAHGFSSAADGPTYTQYLLGPLQNLPTTQQPPFYTAMPTYTYPVVTASMAPTTTYMQYYPVVSTPQYQTHAPSLYHPSSAGHRQLTHMNTSRTRPAGAAVRTEPRSVFLGELPHTTTREGLKKFIRSQTTSGSFELEMPSGSSGECCGHAIIRFATQSDAQNAVATLNEIYFMGKRLSARLDKDRTTVSEGKGPLVVDGSGQSRKSSASRRR